METPISQQQASEPTVLVQVESGNSGVREYRFTSSFKIGRSDDSDVCIKNEFVSRSHVSVEPDNGTWWLNDLNSSNGVYVGDQRIVRISLNEPIIIRLGVRGPKVSLAVLQPVKPVELDKAKQMEEYAQHYFGQSSSRPAGEHTMLIRAAFKQVQQKEKHKYRRIVVSLLFVVISLGLFAAYQYRQASRQRGIARDIFYTIKALDLDIANLQSAVRISNSQQGLTQIRKIEDRRAQLEDSYNHYLATLHVYSPKMNEEDRLILRISRIFGECELDMPPDFVSEVHKYIKYWQSSDRLKKAILLANEKGYTASISKEMLNEGLPPQFFYLALQESSFDQYASGPPTRKGIAKGMWQFIPETALKYGLHLGPLVDMARPDVLDDRHHYQLETVAAGRYLKDLYGSDAQASGLLVMACYNWDENQLLPLVRSMPLNPRERNFWALLQRHRDQIPKQTYDYVFYIVSAAVIGENPRLFGFDFDNPLASSTTRL